MDAKGNLRVPENYRSLYQALGSWAIATDSGAGSKEIHEVYASPGAIDAYRKTGRFPDRTVLVKEVFGTSTNQMTTGTVSHAGSRRHSMKDVPTEPPSGLEIVCLLSRDDPRDAFLSPKAHSPWELSPGAIVRRRCSSPGSNRTRCPGIR